VKITFIVLVLIVLAGCSTKSCKLNPGIDIDVETVDDLKKPNVTPKAKFGCSF